MSGPLIKAKGHQETTPCCCCCCLLSRMPVSAVHVAQSFRGPLVVWMSPQCPHSFCRHPTGILTVPHGVSVLSGFNPKILSHAPGEGASVPPGEGRRASQKVFRALGFNIYRFKIWKQGFVRFRRLEGRVSDSS